MSCWFNTECSLRNDPKLRNLKVIDLGLNINELGHSRITIKHNDFSGNAILASLTRGVV